MTGSFSTLCCTKAAGGDHEMVDAIVGGSMDHQTNTEPISFPGGTHPCSNEFIVYDNKIIFSSFAHLSYNMVLHFILNHYLEIYFTQLSYHCLKVSVSIKQ